MNQLCTSQLDQNFKLITFIQQISLIMQYFSRNLQTQEQFIFNKRYQNRKILHVPILTVHKNQKQMEQQSKQRIYAERFQCRKHNVQRILWQRHSAEQSIHRNHSSKQNADLTQIPAFDNNNKTQYRTNSNRSFTNLKNKSEQTGSLGQPRNTTIKRLLKKFSKNIIKSNISFLLGKEEFSESRTLLLRKHSKYGSLSESLSCKLVAYHNSNQLSSYNNNKVLINYSYQPSLQKKEQKKKKQIYIKQPSIRNNAIKEEIIAGWHINMENNQANQINICSLQTYQL